MHVTRVLNKPILSEKTYLGFKDQCYTFKVEKKANKIQIKKAFEEIFSVKVEKVRTTNYRSKDKKVGKFAGKVPAYKKAMITLKPGEKFELLSDL